MADTAVVADRFRAPDRALAVRVPDSVLGWLDGGTVTARVGFDLDFESRNRAEAARQHRQLLSIRLGSDDAVIGPRWLPGATASCAGCAEVRMRLAIDHPLVARGDLNATPRSGWPAVLAILVEVALDHLGSYALAAGEMLRVGLTETRRHRVVRSPACPICGPRRAPAPVPPDPPVPPVPPGRLTLWPRPSPHEVPLRGAPNPALTDAALAGLVDHRVGPIVRLVRDDRAPFAMSGALLPGARAMGYGRAATFGPAAAVAILEAYERLGAFPHQGHIVAGLAYSDIGARAVDPLSLGQYSQAQLDHPNCRVMPYHPDRPMDWVYAHRLDNGEPQLVPADVAFFGYEYQHRLDEHRARHDARPRRRIRFFAESSSGCALGSSLEEASLHALMELIERDSFLMAWCRRRPLPAIDPASIDDPTSRLLLESIDARGFDVHLLATTYDLGLPSVWALAVNRTPGAIPATLSAAGAHPRPADAVRAALWELTQLVARPLDWDGRAVRRLLADPSQVDSIEDHVHLYALPERRHRIAEVLGGPVATLTEAFPGWPEQLMAAAAGDVLGALGYVVDLCRGAGLTDVLVVDQSTREHRDLGLRVARVIVPGILPMCFGAPQQRLGGLARRERALAELGRTDDDPDLLCDPHPFP